MAVPHRHLTAAGGQVPSPASLNRVVHRDLEAGRVSPDRAVVRHEREEQLTRQALGDLAPASPRQGDVAQEAALRLPRAKSMVALAVPVGEERFGGGCGVAGGSVVGADVVGAGGGRGGWAGDGGRGRGVCVLRPGPGQDRGRSDGAQRGACGLEGDVGAGAPVGGRHETGGVQRLALPGRFPQASALADATVAGALGEAGVIVIDEAQCLPLPCLEYLQSLWDHPGTRITLLLCGAGTERALARLPQLASRIGARQEVPRVAAAEVTAVATGFHPLWRTVSAEDLPSAIPARTLLVQRLRAPPRGRDTRGCAVRDQAPPGLGDDRDRAGRRDQRLLGDRRRSLRTGPSATACPGDTRNRPRAGRRLLDESADQPGQRPCSRGHCRGPVCPPRPGNGTVPATARRARATTTGPGSPSALAATAIC